MKNHEVAACFVDNALAYAKCELPEAADRLKVVVVNLKIIEALLEKPNAENREYDWDDFR